MYRTTVPEPDRFLAHYLVIMGSMQQESRPAVCFRAISNLGTLGLRRPDVTEPHVLVEGDAAVQGNVMRKLAQRLGMRRAA